MLLSLCKCETNMESENIDNENMLRQLRLTIRILNDRISQLESELFFFKSEITKDFLENVATNSVSKKRIVSQEARDKLEYYHTHKETVIRHISSKYGIPEEGVSWTLVKKYTDSDFDKQK